MMELMHGKLALLAYEDGKLARRRPAADTFALLAGLLDGAESVIRTDRADDPDVFAFVVERADYGAALVVWKDGNMTYGEQEAPTVLECDWPHDTLVATDAFGAAKTVRLTAAALGSTVGHANIPDPKAYKSTTRAIGREAAVASACVRHVDRADELARKNRLRDPAWTLGMAIVR